MNDLLFQSPSLAQNAVRGADLPLEVHCGFQVAEMYVQLFIRTANGQVLMSETFLNQLRSDFATFVRMDYLGM